MKSISCQNRSKAIQNCKRLVAGNPNENGSQITLNLTLHSQVWSYGFKKILPSLITNLKYKTNSNLYSWENKLPNHASHQKYSWPSMSSGRARTWTTQSVGKHANHEVTGPLLLLELLLSLSLTQLWNIWSFVVGYSVFIYFFRCTVFWDTVLRSWDMRRTDSWKSCMKRQLGILMKSTSHLGVHLMHSN